MKGSSRINDKNADLTKKYAKKNNQTVTELDDEVFTEFLRQAVLEHIEDKCDSRLYKKAIKKYKENPVTYTLDEVKKELDTQDTK